MNYVDRHYNATVEKVRNIARDKAWLAADECTDNMGRQIVTAITGTLKPGEQPDIILLNST